MKAREARLRALERLISAPAQMGVSIWWVDEDGAVCGVTPAAPPPPKYGRTPVDYRAGLLPPSSTPEK